MNTPQFTPALGFKALTPFYDSAVALLTRESVWRPYLVALVCPQPNDRILDVGCGTGSTLLQLANREPRAALIGLDPDPEVLARAKNKLIGTQSRIEWRQGFFDEHAASQLRPVNKILSSLVLHQTPMPEKRRILSNMRFSLESGGKLFIADYGAQTSFAMRALFRITVQVFDGVRNTQPNADGCIPILMEEAGFSDVRIRRSLKTATGSISLFEASN